ncbi:MAG: hypothetical protein KGH77_03995 [Candidatus Micrarchaeota archaeon]|nr:hypothetical protein [Candidatus Micrarchaeota archaeon]MDE1864562.1 hypothetical protein [Candidatus Micrarchaeota archaeon]
MNKKSHPKFVVPGYGVKNRGRVKHRWRKQRGTDNKKRVALSGYGAMPHIGYKNAKSIRFMRADGSREVLVHNEQELVALTKNPADGMVVVIAHDISKRKRIAMQGVADKFKIRIVNRIKEIAQKNEGKKNAAKQARAAAEPDTQAGKVSK